MKHTAANTPALASVKRVMNAPIYKSALKIYNRDGEQVMWDYLDIYFFNGASRDVIPELDKKYASYLDQ
jgi:hypothetical protein